MSTGGTSARPHTASLDAASFRVLGPLEMWVGGERVEVGGRQERALLALLLTAPGRVFSVPAIVAGLWGDRPPTAADRTVMSYVSRLRRGLPEGATAVVATRRPGYLVAVDPDRVDAERFRTLVASGHGDLDAGHPGEAGARLREALALWHGDAYAEFDAPFAVAERRALEELRLAALEGRAAADLAVGAGPELVGELEALVAEHPLRERLWAHLMTALYRAGRQGDALRTYRRARAVLAEELGVEPGDELQALHARVLTHDPVLAGPTAPPSPRKRGPVVGPAFVGRTRELATLRDAYRHAVAGTERVLVTGEHGMGKTRLLTELARHVEDVGGTVIVDPALAGAAADAAPVLVVLDDLQRRAVDTLARLAPVLSAQRGPTLVVAACVPDELSPEQFTEVADLFPVRLPLPPLEPEEVATLVRLYVPGPGAAEALTSDDVVRAAGVPLHVHAAASRYGETLAAARIGTAALAIAEPRRRLAQSRDRIADGVAEVARLRSLRRAPASPGTARHACPFKGLAFYDVDDAPFFAGRERLVARLVARLVDAPVLAVVGASGSGKSSVVRAGLVPAIREGLLPGSERWEVVVTTPARPTPDLPPATGPPPARAPSSAPRTLLVVDQAEELFTVVPADARAGYARWLTEAAQRDDVTVVVALRSDYFARVAAHPPLADLLAANTVLVGAMSAEELREAVEVPAARAGLPMDEGLAGIIADDVAGEPGGLPLMSTALLSLWERGDGRRLSLADYRELGGVRTAVSRLAEAAYTQMTPTQQAHARRLLLRLAEVDDAGEPVRHRVALGDLAVGGDPDARTALDTLASRRLLTVSATHVEVAHEALLREWPRLRVWLDDDESGRRLRRHLVPAAAAWQSAGRDPSELYRGQRLTAALDFLADRGDDLTEPETEFLRASREAAEADAVARRRSNRRLRGLVAGLAVVLVLALTAGWMAVDRRNESARLAMEADVRALRAAALGEERWDLALLYAAQAYRIDGSAQSQAALQRTVHRSPEATAMYSTDQRMLGLAVSEDGRTLVGLGSGGTAYVWDLATGTRRTTVTGLTELGVMSVDVSRDGRHLAVVGVPPPTALYGTTRHLTVVDLDMTPAPGVRTWSGPEITAARFIDATTVAVLGTDGLVRAVDVRSGYQRDPRGPRAASSDIGAMDAPVGRRFLVASDPRAAGQVTAWETSSGRVVWSSREATGTVASVSPDGAALVLAHADGSVDHVAIVDGARRSVPSDPAGELVDLDWAPDGSSFAGATTAGTVAVWDAQTLSPRNLLGGHAGTVSQVVYSPDGSSLYASGFDGTALTWDLTGTAGVVRRVGAPAPATPLGPFGETTRVLARDGSLALAYRDEGALELLEIPAGTSTVLPIPLPGFPAHVFTDPAGRRAGLFTVHWPEGADAEIQVVDVASGRRFPMIRLRADYVSPPPVFSGDGRSVVAVHDDGNVDVWDVRTGQRTAGSTRYDAPADVLSAATDATGRTVALGTRGGGVEVGDTVTGERVAAPVWPGGEGLTVHPLSFSPDGRWLAGGSETGRVVVWDTETWDVRRMWVAVQGGGVDSLAFTPDSRSLVVGGAGTASIQGIGPGPAAVMTLRLGSSPSRSEVAVASRDGGETVVTLTEDEGVQLWPVAPQALLRQACDVAGRNLTRAEWSAALPNLPYAHTCPRR